MSSIKNKFIEIASKHGDNKTVMCRKIEMSPSGFKGPQLSTGVNSESIAKFLSVYGEKYLGYLFDTTNENAPAVGMEGSTEEYSTSKLEAGTGNHLDKDNDFIIDVLNRNNISLNRTNEYLIKKLNKYERDS